MVDLSKDELLFKKMCQVKMLNSEPDVLIFKILICSDNLLISAFLVHLP